MLQESRMVKAYSPTFCCDVPSWPYARTPATSGPPGKHQAIACTCPCRSVSFRCCADEPPLTICRASSGCSQSGYPSYCVARSARSRCAWHRVCQAPLQQRQTRMRLRHMPATPFKLGSPVARLTDFLGWLLLVCFIFLLPM